MLIHGLEYVIAVRWRGAEKLCMHVASSQRDKGLNVRRPRARVWSPTSNLSVK